MATFFSKIDNILMPSRHVKIIAVHSVHVCVQFLKNSDIDSA